MVCANGRKRPAVACVLGPRRQTPRSTRSAPGSVDTGQIPPRAEGVSRSLKSSRRSAFHPEACAMRVWACERECVGLDSSRRNVRDRVPSSVTRSSQQVVTVLSRRGVGPHLRRSIRTPPARSTLPSLSENQRLRRNRSSHNWAPTPPLFSDRLLSPRLSCFPLVHRISG